MGQQAGKGAGNWGELQGWSQLMGGANAGSPLPVQGGGPGGPRQAGPGAMTGGDWMSGSGMGPTKNPYLEQAPGSPRPVRAGDTWTGPIEQNPYNPGKQRPRPRMGGDDMQANMGGGRYQMDPTQSRDYQKRMQQAMMAAGGGFGSGVMQTGVYDRGGAAGGYAPGGMMGGALGNKNLTKYARR